MSCDEELHNLDCQLFFHKRWRIIGQQVQEKDHLIISATSFVCSWTLTFSSGVNLKELTSKCSCITIEPSPFPQTTELWALDKLSLPNLWFKKLSVKLGPLWEVEVEMRFSLTIRKEAPMAATAAWNAYEKALSLMLMKVVLETYLEFF